MVTVVFKIQNSPPPMRCRQGHILSEVKRQEDRHNSLEKKELGYTGFCIGVLAANASVALYAGNKAKRSNIKRAVSDGVGLKLLL